MFNGAVRSIVAIHQNVSRISSVTACGFQSVKCKDRAMLHPILEVFSEIGHTSRHSREDTKPERHGRDWRR